MWRGSDLLENQSVRANTSKWLKIWKNLFSQFFLLVQDIFCGFLLLHYRFVPNVSQMWSWGLLCWIYLGGPITGRAYCKFHVFQPDVCSNIWSLRLIGRRTRTLEQLFNDIDIDICRAVAATSADVVFPIKFCWLSQPVEGECAQPAITIQKRTFPAANGQRYINNCIL